MLAGRNEVHHRSLTRGACGEVLAYQLGYEQQCGAGPVVSDDVLRLPGGVARDQDDVTDLIAADRAV